MDKATLESSLNTLDIWLIAFGVLVAIGVVGESVAGFLHWRRSGQLQVIQTAENLGLQTEIKRLGAATAEANVEVAKANENAAAAQARAAALEKEAAEARAEQERLKAQFAWRTLPQDLATQLENALAQHPGKINIQNVANDPEALYLAIQFANLFGRAHWQVATMSLTMGGTLIFGLWIPDSPAPDTANVQAAFRAAQIGFSTNALPTSGVSMGMGGTLQGAPTLFVGSKPIPR